MSIRVVTHENLKHDCNVHGKTVGGVVDSMIRSFLNRREREQAAETQALLDIESWEGWER